MNPITSEFIVGLLAVGLNYAATFKIPSSSILTDPVQTLSTTIPVLVVGHVVLIVLSHLLKGTMNKALKSVCYSLLFAIVVTGMLHILTVLFGAPLIEKIPNTFLFSAYLSILTMMPCYQSFRENAWFKVFVQHSPSTTSEIYAYAQAICSLSGAWIGAIVLPLDWDREWQAWPISCIISTYVGHAVGVLAAFVWSSVKLIFGKKKTE